MKKIAIIGGGAAGLAAAIAAGNELARLGAAGECEIVLFEADSERVGRSILATGNGRCNFSNAHIDPACYRNADFVEAALRSLATLSEASGQRGAQPAGACEVPGWGSVQPAGDPGVSGRGSARRASAQPLGTYEAPVQGGAQPAGAFEAPVQRFFSSLGLMWREEGEGRLYPAANKASSVLDVLRAALDVSGARVESGKTLRAIEAPARGNGRFHLRFSDGSIAHAEKVVLAVGGRGMSAVEMPPAILCEPTRPVLGPLATDSRITRQLNNIRVKCAVSLERSGSLVAREEGELLFRDYGVSGVCVFNLSRLACEGDVLSIDFQPHMPAADRDAWLFARRKHLSARLGENGQIAAEDVLRGAMLPQVAQVLCKCASVDPARPLSKKDVLALSRVIGGLRLTVRGIGDAKQCQVSRGGLSVAAFDPHTMEAPALPGLFAAGEALDVDAPCGGYNLHWAWASGLLAGASAACGVEGAGLGEANHPTPVSPTNPVSPDAVSADGEGEGE